jgi:hypothetical protein
MLSLRQTLWALSYGLLIWFEAALTIRFLSFYIFRPGDLTWMAGIFGGTAILAFGLGWFYFSVFQTTPAQRVASALLICAVGLIGDAIILMKPDVFFPGMTHEQLALFAAWFVWGYGLGVISGLWPRALYGVPAD